ncbi:branched-chain amino acid ABC transporter permease [Undibacter mobilis]|uniref:Branched-chain amino acid ABC transporter permease n=1 Tax=Undibacter mobilis TaxID=2292256 RepID=A0A371B3A7_9BRAD|nr:branched-chain amino acid ABC transporter permease [Undibacter mobilis]RDV02004.1 branched-chain amino acid ABC transporter permease [Undibacter mobilis]
MPGSSIEFRVVILAVVLAILGIATFLSDYDLRLAILAILAAISVIGLYFAFGLAGMIHLAQGAFVGIGAYFSAVLVLRTGLSPWITVLIATAATTLISALLAYPMHRTKSHYLALITVGFNVSFEVIIRNWISMTGGYDGIGGIPLLRIGTPLRSELEFFYIAVAALIVCALIASLLRTSHIGRAMVAVRDDELAAAASGINVARTKTLAFVICSGYGGLSGALYAHYSGFISPDDFSLGRSIILLSMLIVGGEFSILGAIVGAVVLSYLPEWLRFVGGGYMAVFGLLMLGVLIIMPNGIMGSLRSRWRLAMSKDR